MLSVTSESPRSIAMRSISTFAIDRIGAGGSFGVWALFDDEPRMTGAAATESSRLLFVPRDEFYDVLSDHVDIAQGIFKQLVQRVRRLAAVAEK